MPAVGSEPNPATHLEREDHGRAHTRPSARAIALLGPSSPPLQVIDNPSGASVGLRALQVVAALLLGAAAVGFLRRGNRSGDQLLHWLAATLVLAAFARLNYFLTPSLYAHSLSLGDVLRAASFVCLLIGGLAEIGVYRRQAAAAAQAEERERIARDLHDGLAQDLAFVAGRLRDLAARPNGLAAGHSEMLTMLSSAARRALDESRVAVSTLAAPRSPLSAAVEQAAEEVATREGGKLVLETASNVEAFPATKQALLRIVREAVGNAFRHGDPTTVYVTFEATDDGVALEVRDDGRGFTEGRAGGLGLDSMRQRARECGGQAVVDSTPGEGTLVAVRLPSDRISEVGDHLAVPSA
jgi:signal transduction histidine kinase